MTNSLFAAVYAAEFPAQAILRLRPDLQSQAVVILDGSPPQERVCSLNLHARKRGIVAGMTRLEVEETCGVRILSRSFETESAARSVLLECMSLFSPRIEETFAQNTCGFVLDISGTERLFGPPDKLTKRLREAIIATGFRTSISVSTNFDTARIKAEFSRGITIIPSGEETVALATIPVSSLRLDEEHDETFAIWGIRTLGELALLPLEDLISRFGQKSILWLSLSRGIAEHTFLPLEKKFQLREHIEFESHVEQLDSLLFIAANMIDALLTRAAGRAMSLSTLTVEMSLEGLREYKRVIQPAIPSNDRKFLLKLLQLEVAAHPPQSAIKSLTITAEAGQQSKVQLGLFSPRTPEPSRLDVTIARLKAIVGTDRVGSPALKNTHRPGHFEMNEFAISSQAYSGTGASARASLRRIRMPHPLQVHLHFHKPVSFRDGTNRYEVLAAYGPWRSSGNWWSVDKWDLDEWDVMASNQFGISVGCLIIHDHLTDRWLLEAFYD